MLVIANRFLHEPALFVAAVVGLLAAVLAAGSVLASGGAVIVGVLAGISSLLASLGGGAVVRQNVSPVAVLESSARPDLIEIGAPEEPLDIDEEDVAPLSD